MYPEKPGAGMEFKYRAVDEQSARHPPPSSYTYFTEQAIIAGYMGSGLGRMQESFQNPVLSREAIQRDTSHCISAGYMGPGLGRTQENFQNPVLTREAIQRDTSDCISAGSMGPGLGRTQENFQNPVLTREAIQRELEKERIREEIIIAAETRRRVLEAEVKREMMLGRELGYRGRGNGFGCFSFVPGAGMSFDPTELSFSQVERRSIEDRIAMSLEGKLGNASKHETGGRVIVPFQERAVNPKIAGHEMIHFQQRAVEPKIAGHEMIPLQQRAVAPKIAVVPYPEVTKEKEKIVFVAKPQSNLSGQKRKSVTPEDTYTSELPLIGVTKKKVKEEWSCSICQVSATNERGLNEHLQGKKHKLKEAALMAKRNGSIGIGANNAVNSQKLKETPYNSSSVQGGKLMVQLLQSSQVGKSSLHSIPIEKSPKENEVQVLEVTPKADISKNQVLETGAEKKLTKKKKKFQFWCQNCRVGAHSEDVMEAHRNGKKHKAALEEAVKNVAVATPLVGSNLIGETC